MKNKLKNKYTLNILKQLSLTIKKPKPSNGPECFFKQFGSSPVPLKIHVTN